MRTYSLDRWNWSERAEKWVFVSKTQNGKRTYQYQLKPPQEFLDLTNELKKLNKKLMAATDILENQRLFNDLMKLTKKMQEMRK